MEQFLDFLGQRVTLTNHTGYRGGLDTQFGQTGQQSVYTQYKGAEIMFHVSTMLPYNKHDIQQLERKRHIGNDIVSIVFQEGLTPFNPDSVTSHFLHAYIVIQPDPRNTDSYKVAIVTRSDVPNFGPNIPDPPVFKSGPKFRKWILEKLVNAETACYKAKKFRKLKERTREALLESLVGDLVDKSESYIGQSSLGRLYSSTPESSQNFFNTVKKVFVSKRKSHLSVFDTRISHSAPTEEVDSGIVSVVDGDSIKHDLHEDSDNIDTDDALDYISVDEASNINMNVDPEVFAQFMKLHQDISKLKFDKLELLKQNAEAQKQVQE